MGNIERSDLRAGYERLTHERDELRRMLGVAETVTQRQGEEVERLREQLRGAVEALRAVEDWFGRPRDGEGWPEASARLDEVLRQVHAVIASGGQSAGPVYRSGDSA